MTGSYISNASSTSPHPLPSPPPPTALCRARAIATYKGDPSPGLDLATLTFVEGDTIEVLSKCDNFWWQGRMARTPPIQQQHHAEGAASPTSLESERAGFFPVRFVKELAHGRPSHTPLPIDGLASPTAGFGAGFHHVNGSPASPSFSPSGVKNDPLSPSQRMNILNPMQQQMQQQQQQHPSQHRRHSLMQQKSVEDERVELMSYPWFVQQMERLQAEQALKNAAQGTFMIRESIRTGGKEE